MITLVLVPLIVAVIVGAGAPRVALGMSPAVAAKALVAVALTVSLVVGAMLGLAGLIGLRLAFADLRPFDWEPAEIRRLIPLPAWIGVGCAASAGLLLLAAIVRAARSGRAWRRASRTARELPATGGVVVADDAELYAYAVPGRPGRVVVSSGLRDTLSADERAAVVEHERSHLRHHHFVYGQLVRVASSANPLLRPLVPAVDLAVERWADDDACRRVGDPAVVARAISSVGRRSSPRLAAGLDAGHHAVVERARFLLDPPTTRPAGRLALILAAAVLCFAGAALGVLVVNDLVEAAERASLR